MLRGDGDEWRRRSSPAIAWTGERLFVYGGNPVPTERQSAGEPLNDAALIDPADGDIERLADPPFDRPLRATAAVVAIDDEVVVVGQLCREPDDSSSVICAGGAYHAAVYSLTDESWREIELPTRLQRVSNGQHEPVGATSDGRAVFVLGPRGAFGAVASREIWTYSPADDEWEPLPSPGSLIEGFCMAGDAVVIGSGLLPTDPDPDADDAVAEAPVDAQPTDAPGTGPVLRLLALDEEPRVWLPTPAAGFLPVGDQPSITCGDELVLFDDGSVGGRRVYDIGPDGGWRQIAEAPGDDVHALRLWDGEEFLFLDRQSPTLAYDPDADSWRGIEGSAGTGARSVWTGEEVVGWPGPTDLPVQFAVDR